MKVGICVGHSRRGDHGAISRGNVSEWDYNSILAAHLSDRLTRDDIDHIVVRDYQYRSYSTAMDWLAAHLKHEGCDLAIELHFNAAGPSANGHEWLYWHRSDRGQEAASTLCSEFASAFPESANRGAKAKGKGDRGATFLRKTHCPAVICEPFFGSNAAEWATFDQQQSAIADAYAAAICSLSQ